MKADTCTQIRVTRSPQDVSHDSTLNPTRQRCCPGKFTVTKVTCQQEAAFPALLRPLQAAPSACREDEGSSHSTRKASKGKAAAQTGQPVDKRSLSTVRLRIRQLIVTH